MEIIITCGMGLQIPFGIFLKIPSWDNLWRIKGNYTGNRKGVVSLTLVKTLSKSDLKHFNIQDYDKAIADMLPGVSNITC